MSHYLPRQLRNDILDLRGGALLLLRRILRGLCRSHFGLKYEDLKGPSYSETTICSISNTTEHILTKFGVLFSCMDSAWCMEDGFI